jgi:sigma-B regulation protein RsbU (phosphoserine phosphatase)
MEVSVFERIRGNLLAKRQNLAEWLATAPPWKQQIRLGPAGEQAMQAHLHVLDTAIEKTANHSLGICEVCHEYVDLELLQMDYTACVCLDHFSEAERRQLEADLELSQKVQKGLLPQQIPAIPGLDLAIFSRPAQIVGGDYFDFFHFRDGSHGLAIGDVAGHGMSASMLMASVQTFLHTLIPEHDSPVEVLRRLNNFFYHNVQVTTFVTLFLGQFDPATRTLTYSNAGHNPPLVLRREADGQEPVAWLKPTGAAIGLIEGFQSGLDSVTLAPGDILLLYTDGVTEAANPQKEEFGRDRLAALVRRAAGHSAGELVQALRTALQQFTHDRPFADDTTVIVCKVVSAA